MLSALTFRGDIHAVSATEVQFAAAGGLTVQPIRIWAASGRQAALTALPSAGVVSGEAGTKYVYAALAAPSGSPYGAEPGGLIDRWLTALPWNRELIQDTFMMLHPGGGTLLPTSRASAVTIVVTDSATPPDTHHHPIGSVAWDGMAIESVTSYANSSALSISTVSNGQCWLSLSGANLALLPFDGQSLLIAGVTRSVPTAGVTLAPTSLTPGTFYFIYAAWSAGSMTLLASTTPPVTHTNGVQIMSEMPENTYVGRAYIAAGPAWSTLVPVKSHYHEPAPDVLIRAVGNPYKTVEITTTETSIFPAILPKLASGTLAADEHLEILVFGDFLQNVGSLSFNLRIKLGTTTILAIVNAIHYNPSATRRGWHFVGYLSGRESLVSQAARGLYIGTYSALVGTVDGSASSDANAPIYHSSHSGIVEDGATDLPVDITLQPHYPHTLVSIRVFSVLVRRMRRR